MLVVARSGHNAANAQARLVCVVNSALERRPAAHSPSTPDLAPGTSPHPSCVRQSSHSPGNRVRSLSAGTSNTRCGAALSHADASYDSCGPSSQRRWPKFTVGRSRYSRNCSLYATSASSSSAFTCAEHRAHECAARLVGIHGGRDASKRRRCVSEPSATGQAASGARRDGDGRPTPHSTRYSISSCGTGRLAATSRSTANFAATACATGEDGRAAEEAAPASVLPGALRAAPAVPINGKEAMASAGSAGRT